MNKTVCWDVCDYIAKMTQQLEDAGDGVESIESFLGVEFAMRDSTGHVQFLGDISDRTSAFGHVDVDSSKAYDELAYWEEQEVAIDVFRVVGSPQELPVKYPVLVLTIFEEGFDRHGSTSARIIEFVYRDDFFSQVR